MSVFFDLTSDYSVNYVATDRIAGYTATSNRREQTYFYEEFIPVGSTITEEHWVKDQLFEGVILERYNSTMEDFWKEIKESRAEGRGTTTSHLENMFSRAYKLVYGRDAIYTESKEPDQYYNTLFQAEGKFNIGSY